jgi:rhodanese-related sulfurtransferase
MTATIERIHPAELAELRKSKEIALIDVRTPAEFEEVHADGARSVPLDKLDPKALAAECGGVECIYLICRSGGRGKQACDKLLAAGIRNVVNVEGGTQAWEQAGLPVVRGRKTMSLERQVRIAAGSLVLVGAALGAFVHIGFIGFSAFIGAGLVFAGLTDTCGMGMLLARMPWNRRGASSACAR